MMAGWSETKPRQNTGGGDEHSRCCEVTNAGKRKGFTLMVEGTSSFFCTKNFISLVFFKNKDFKTQSSFNKLILSS